MSAKYWKNGVYVWMCLQALLVEQGFILRLVRASRDRYGLGREPLSRYDRGGLYRDRRREWTFAVVFSRPPAPYSSRLLLFPEGAQDGGYPLSAMYEKYPSVSTCKGRFCMNRKKSVERAWARQMFSWWFAADKRWSRWWCTWWLVTRTPCLVFTVLIPLYLLYRWIYSRELVVFCGIFLTR